VRALLGSQHLDIVVPEAVAIPGNAAVVFETGNIGIYHNSRLVNSTNTNTCTSTNTGVS
jgi:hypothetical protein